MPTANCQLTFEQRAIRMQRFIAAAKGEPLTRFITADVNAELGAQYSPKQYMTTRDRVRLLAVIDRERKEGVFPMTPKRGHR